ncbi:MAG: XdhC family protein [SAR324 cluster bacterium]|nr:XdhC family protein [SAR324 cluster bacterium]
MHREYYRRITALQEAAEPFVVATVIRVHGSASAKPGSKAIIDRTGRNILGWVGGGCAESLVREESLKALEDRLTRIVNVDLEDEVLGVGMPCGGKMDVYIEPHFPPRRLLIAGHNKLARHLNLLAQYVGYAVTVHGPEAEAQHFPGAAHIASEPWEMLDVAPGMRLIATPPHEGQAAVLRAGLAAQQGYFGFVARKKVLAGLGEQLSREGFDAAGITEVRNPAGLDLGGDTVEEISLSIIGELMAWEYGASANPLRKIEAGTASMDKSVVMGEGADGGLPELLVVGHGRLSEELARVGTLMGWPVTVNAVETFPEDYPPATRLVHGDLDFSRMEVTPATHVVIATLHKGDHLSMERALQGKAAYVGLIASRKRSGLVLDYLRERDWSDDQLAHVRAPAGLDLGARTPAEIALSIACEIVQIRRSGNGGGLSRLPTAELEEGPRKSSGETCQQLFE